MPRAVADPSWHGVGGRVRFAVRGASWLAALRARARAVDLVHVHSGAMLKHTRYLGRRFVLHLHGTDIRSLQYDPAWREAILRGVREADAVLYSTPDLAEHVLPLRADAELFPVPVAFGDLPPKAQRPEPRIFFASRWEDVKGLEDQLAIARRLVERAPEGFEVVGLDWGPGAQAAREAGVRLLPKMPNDEYLRTLASSALVVGQSAGILSSSELEAIALDVPVAAPLAPGYYPDAPPVLGGETAWRNPEAVADAALAALAAPPALGEPDAPGGPDEPGSPDDARATDTRGSDWIRRTHDAVLGYERLAKLYSDLLDART